MENKLIEIRDAATFIPALAIRINGSRGCLDGFNNNDAWLIRAAGYGFSSDYVILVKLDGVEAKYDPYQWSNFRTMGNAHEYIRNNWDSIKSGDMIDVRTILGEQENNPESESNNYTSF